MKCQIRKLLSKLLLGAFMFAIVLGLGMVASPSVTADIQQLEEAPGQTLYQSRQTLQDQHGNRWQVIAFKRIRPNGRTSVDLRLVGFPGVAEIDHSQPLMLKNSLGKTFVAAANDRDIFTDVAKPEPNVGQYDLQSLLPQLQAEIPLKLLVPTTQEKAVHLSVSPSIVQEWQTIALENGSFTS
jgi:hypothetical protein